MHKASFLITRLKNKVEFSFLDFELLDCLLPFQNITYNIMAAMKENFAYQDDQLAKTKQEFREGFRELQESMDNLKIIVEGRRKIMGRQMRREIGKVKNTMFIEMPPSDGTLAIAYPTYQK